jgi:signal transduction histidine kinase
MVLDGDFGSVGEGMRRALSDAEGKAEELLALIEDLLEVARIEDATITLDLCPIAPGAFLAEVVEEWSVRFRQEGASVRVEVSDDAPVFEADRGLLKRVFSNLIQNALTHTTNAVSLTLSARRDADGGILFTVADNGPGIPREYHELIFRKFERVRTPETPRVRSSGLGLAFCKLAVEAHGGRIWVASSEGRGSEFYVALPPRPPSSTSSSAVGAGA